MVQWYQTFKRPLARVLLPMLFMAGGNSPGLAQSPELDPGFLDLELNKSPKSCFVKLKDLPPPPLSQTSPSIPNLWLAQEIYGNASQFPVFPDDSKMDQETQPEADPRNIVLDTWYVEPAITQVAPELTVNNLVTLVVDRQVWRRERYMGQYVFVNRFGTVVRDYGYNMRVCNREGDWLANYICDFETAPLECRIQIQGIGLQIRDFKVFTPDPPGNNPDN
ncbi:MAG: hypothetical protein HC835_13295 [Oscillatoriales cyanobacterium RM2_1_1]|nr:hypothetical protein [Oscillatoriales cyanobacterium SM2_3_0]NJO46521.1 hypothetical protein [Oscillatoriales cyanobacterium RM2_1_1]